MKKFYSPAFYSKAVVLCCLIALGSLLITLSFTSHLPEKKEEEEGVPGVFSSMNLWGEMRTYPFKRFPSESYTRSFQQSRSMDMATLRTRNGLAARVQATDPWINLAPMNFAGRILCLAFHPTNPDIMFAGSASGGLWKTTVGGTGGTNGISWEYVETGFPVLGVSSVLIHPTNPNIIYAGTGEVYNANTTETGTTGAGNIRTFRGTYGVGIIKSVDGGVTWTKSLDFSRANNLSVNQMAFDPNNPAVVFAATTEGVYRTTDNGLNWTLVHSIVMAMDLCFKPGSSSVLYVGSGNFGTTGAGLYKSTNANTSTPSFTRLSSGLPSYISGKTMVDISPNNPNRVYASVGKAPSTSDTNGFYYSSNEGASFTRNTNTAIINNQGWFAHDVAASRTNANTVFWAEMDVYQHNSGGTTAFTKISSWNLWDVNKTTVGTTREGTANTYVHADIHRMEFSPHNSNLLYIMSDGGIFRYDLSNTANGFIALNGGLNTAQIYANMAVSGTTNSFMLGGMQDNEGLIYRGQAGCRRVPNLGDGFHAAIDPTNDNICYIASYFLNVRKSTNNAVNWSTINSNAGLPPSENACFNAPFVLAPSAPSTIYGGTVFLKKSTNGGSSWSNMNGGTRVVNDDAPILTIAVAPSNANVVYLSTVPGGGANARMYRSTNGGSNLTNITGSLPNRYYSKIAVDPTNPNRIAIVLSGFGSSHAFLSHDAGNNWTDIDGNLPDIPHNTVMFDPNSLGTLLVGNDIGVFYVQNLPTTGTLPAVLTPNWIAYNEGLGDAALISDLSVAPNGKLRMASYGRGFWERDMPVAGTLPVKLEYFKGIARNNGNELTWMASLEEGTKHYVVEYSTNGRDFLSAAVLQPKGTDQGPAAYQFFHPIQWNGKIQYRLRMVDLDNSQEFSETITLEQQGKGDWLLFPNPVVNDAFLTGSTTRNEPLQIRVYDVNGKTVYSFYTQLPTGNHRLNLPLARLSEGYYVLSIESTTVKRKIPFVKSK